MTLGPKLMRAPGQGGGKGVGAAPPIKHESRVGIQAPAQAVWDVLADLPRWGEWNPMYPQASGELRIGAALSVTQTLEGKTPVQLTPRVIDWVPLEQILWSHSVWRGWAKATRYMEIESVAKAACIFSNGEIYKGGFSELYAEQNRRAVRQSLRAMSDALKERAEALWRSQQDETK